MKKTFSTLLRKSSKKLNPDDVELEREINQLHQSNEKTRKVYKDMKQCISAESDMASSQSKLSSELRARSCARNEPLKAPVEGFCNALDEMACGTTSYSGEWQANQRRVFVDALKRFYKTANHIDQNVHKREAKKQDYEKALAKLERLKRSTGNPSKLESAQRDLRNIEAEYSKVHLLLMEELPQLHKARMEYFSPCLEASMETELLYHQRSAEAFQSLTAQLTPLPSDENNIQKQTDELLSQIKAIQIVGHEQST